MATSTFYDQISANKRNSFLMAAFVVAILAVLGFTIGYAIVGSPAGGVVVHRLWRWRSARSPGSPPISAATSSS